MPDEQTRQEISAAMNEAARQLGVMKGRMEDIAALAYALIHTPREHALPRDVVKGLERISGWARNEAPDA